MILHLLLVLLAAAPIRVTDRNGLQKAFDQLATQDITVEVEGVIPIKGHSVETPMKAPHSLTMYGVTPGAGFSNGEMVLPDWSKPIPWFALIRLSNARAVLSDLEFSRCERSGAAVEVYKLDNLTCRNVTFDAIGMFRLPSATTQPTQASQTVYRQCVYGSADVAVFSHCQFRRFGWAWRFWEHAVYLQSKRAVFTDCTFAEGGQALAVDGDVTVLNCTMSNPHKGRANDDSYDYPAIWSFHPTSRVTAIGNVFSGNWGLLCTGQPGPSVFLFNDYSKATFTTKQVWNDYFAGRAETMDDWHGAGFDSATQPSR